MSQTSSEVSGGPSNSDRRYAVAALLLEKWMSEDTDYDERVWPMLEEEMGDSCLRCSACSVSHGL